MSLTERAVGPSEAEAIVASSWNDVVEAVALQHNSDPKCVLQHLAVSNEVLSAETLGERLDEFGVILTAERETITQYVAQRVKDCFVPNNTFKLLSPKDAPPEALRLKKLARPEQDSIAGYMLGVSEPSKRSLTELVGRTTIPSGQRRAPIFRLGILRELVNADPDGPPLGIVDIAERLDTYRPTVLGHVQKLNGMKIVTYATSRHRGLNHSEITLRSASAPRIRGLVKFLEGIATGDEQALAEGLSYRDRVMSNAPLVASLLRKHIKWSPEYRMAAPARVASSHPFSIS
jgi:hypothetical protein